VSKENVYNLNIDIASAIEELLDRRESVCLPGFGTLILEHLSAKLDTEQSTISPPAIKLSYYDTYTSIDPLVNYISTKYKLSQKEAKKAVSVFSERFINVLLNYEEVSIKNIARFIKKDGKIIIEPLETYISKYYRDFAKIKLKELNNDYKVIPTAVISQLESDNEANDHSDAATATEDHDQIEEGVELDSAVDLQNLLPEPTEVEHEELDTAKLLVDNLKEEASEEVDIENGLEQDVETLIPEKKDDKDADEPSSSNYEDKEKTTDVIIINDTSEKKIITPIPSAQDNTVVTNSIIKKSKEELDIKNKLEEVRGQGSEIIGKVKSEVAQAKNETTEPNQAVAETISEYFEFEETPVYIDGNNFSWLKWLGILFMSGLIFFGVWKGCMTTEKPKQSAQTLHKEMSEETLARESNDSNKDNKTVIKNTLVTTDDCIIITGVYTSETNIESMKASLVDLGYDIYTESYGPYTRVGISFTCGDTDLKEEMYKVRSKTNATAWYLQPRVQVD